MPTISVPSPLATYIVYGTFLCLCFGQWVIGFFATPKYGRRKKRKTPTPPTSGRADWGTPEEYERAQTWWQERCARLEAMPPPAEDLPPDRAPSETGPSHRTPAPY